MQTAEEKFTRSARQFCLWVESSPTETDARKALGLLAALHISALELKQGDCGESIESTRISNEQWKAIFARFNSLPFNYYNEFFSPANYDEKEPVVGDLADDLADIYRDLKENLDLYDAGHQAEALWEWKQSFRIHWGRHAVAAIHALHAYFADEYHEL